MELKTSIYNHVRLLLMSCILIAPALQGMPMAPTVDPFGPPPAPPTPPSFSSNRNFGFGGFDLSQISRFNIPPLPPVASSPDLRQPMPPEAANAGASYTSSSVNAEQEYEANNGDSMSGGMGTGQSYNPPPSFSLQPASSYGSHSSSLLDAYYSRGAGYHQTRSYANNNPFGGLFGGMFGSSPTSNLFGAMMVNEFVF